MKANRKGTRNSKNFEVLSGDNFFGKCSEKYRHNPQTFMTRVLVSDILAKSRSRSFDQVSVSKFRSQLHLWWKASTSKLNFEVKSNHKNFVAKVQITYKLHLGAVLSGNFVLNNVAIALFNLNSLCLMLQNF